MRTIWDSTQWRRDGGDYTHRLNYDLDHESVVFDLGGYEGWFTEQINNKYGSKIFCFEPIVEFAERIRDKFKDSKNIMVFSQAVSDKNGKDTIYFDDNSSSTYVITDKPIEIDCVTLDGIMSKHGINQIDLIKINIEGEEYHLLEYMILNDLIKRCNNIQVQFHTVIENYFDRYVNIKNELKKTHYLTYDYPFVWENWKKI